MRVIAWPARANAAKNPYQKLLYDAVEVESEFTVQEFSTLAPLFGPRYDVLHVHWPDGFLAAGRGWRFWIRYVFLRVLFIAVRLRGARLVWTAHNFQRENQRNGERMVRYFWPWFLKRVDAVIYMTRASAQGTSEGAPELAQVPHAIIPHGHYRAVVEKVPKFPDVAHALPQLIFFGAIASYKQAWRVLESFLAMPAGQAALAICGKMSDRSPDLRLREALADLPEERVAEISVDDRFLPEVELIERIRAADLVVFPYGEVLNSGAALFALSVGRPILASDAPVFVELRDQVGAEWVYLIKGDLDGTQLQEALHAARALRTRGEVPNLSVYDWKTIGAQTAAFYRRVLNGSTA